MLKRFKYNYVFYREALRTATCTMLLKASTEKMSYHANWLLKSEKINLEQRAFQYIKYPVECYSNKKHYFLVKDKKVVFIGKVKEKEVSEQVVFDFKHFPVLFNSLIPAYQQDNVSLRKIIRNYPSMLRLYYEMAKRDFFSKLKL